MADTQTVVALVVDCSVVAKWELPGEDYTQEALELYRDWEAEAIMVLSPDLLPSEIGSVFLRAVRRGRVTEAQAQAGMQRLLALPYVLHPSAPLVPRAFDIAHQHNQRIYDCFYVALAEREGMAFWTSDERLYNALNARHPFVRFIAHYVAQRQHPTP